MSKRAGTIVTLEELVEAIGADAGRYALARYSTDSPDRPRPRPVGARTPTTTRSSTCSTPTPGSPACCATPPELGVDRGDLHPELLDHDREGDLLGALGEYPRVIATAAELREPHRVARYLEELAGTYHRFYDACRVLPRGDEEVTDAATAPGCGSSRPPGSCWRTASGCSASTAPERM